MLSRREFVAIPTLAAGAPLRRDQEGGGEEGTARFRASTVLATVDVVAAGDPF